VPSFTSSQNASAVLAALTSNKVRAWVWKPHLLPAPEIVLLWLVGIADNGVADAGAREIREKSDLGERMIAVVRWVTDGLSAARHAPTGRHDRAMLERFKSEQREIRQQISQEIALVPRSPYVVSGPGA
jgi:hypothetical protein